MKKIISSLLALLMLCSVLVFTVSACAEEKITVEEALEEIQTKKGFQHGGTAIVTGNCYLFVAKVCEQLYGVTYNGEGLYESYKSYHRSGNFYTVDEMITGTSLNEETVEEIRNFFLENAYPGDIVHYGKDGSGTHTFMVQSVDEEKLVVFQANWPRKDLPYSSCHVDTIYWSSLAETGKSVYNEDGSLYSMNEIFGNRMRNGAIGISINRFTGYEEMYAVPSDGETEEETESEQAFAFACALKSAYDEMLSDAEAHSSMNSNIPSDLQLTQAVA